MEIRDIETIATRTYFLAENHDKRPEIVVRIGKPQRFPDAVDFFCPVQLTASGVSRFSYAAGIDEVQALGLALKLVAAELENLNDQYRGSLRWIGDEHGDLGFSALG